MPLKKVSCIKPPWHENFMQRNHFHASKYESSMDENEIFIHENDISMLENDIYIHENNMLKNYIFMHENGDSTPKISLDNLFATRNCMGKIGLCTISRMESCYFTVLVQRI